MSKCLKSDQLKKVIKERLQKTTLFFINVMMDLLDKVRLWINVLYRFKNLFDEMPYSTVPKSLILKYQDLNGLYLKGKQGQTGE